MRLLTMAKVFNNPAIVRVFLSKTNNSTLPGKGSTSSSKSGSSKQSKPKSSSVHSTLNESVPGPSANVLCVPETEVGPGASKNSAYKNPEYFTYHPFSYVEAEVEMIKFRLPQPTNKARQ